MSIELLTACIKKLIKIHQLFNELAEEKTECVTKGDIAHLKTLMQKETVQLKQLQRVEQERVRLVQFFMESKGLITEVGTLAEILPHVSDGEKEELVSLQEQIVQQIQTLKQKNQLNQQLIEDSLRFVNLSLDVLQPELETGNYQRPDQGDDEPLGRSLFDSKA
jgi:flagellar biosynthesis/type III secretory pathway chaperone